MNPGVRLYKAVYYQGQAGSRQWTLREIRLGNLEADFERTLVASGFENLVVETLVDDVSEIEGLVPVRQIRIL